MSKFDSGKFDLSEMRMKARASRDDMADIDRMYNQSLSWKAVSQITDKQETSLKTAAPFNFCGKILRGGKYAGEKLAEANFSGADLKETDFSKADLHGADFSGSDLSGADLSDANLDGAVFTGAKLRGTNFTGAKMNGVVLVDADIQDAILLNVQMDQLALEELQALVEYLAVYYPHKLNLSRMNLTMLDFKRIDLSRVNLRGVDFTGVDFTGINIFELDLSECIISPEQIAQALGRVPTPLELKKILAPKNKARKNFKGIDLDQFFHPVGQWGVWDLSKHPGIAVADILNAGKAIYRAFAQPDNPSDEQILAKFQEGHEQKQEEMAKEHNNEVRKIIEERKKELLQSKITENNHEETNNIQKEKDLQQIAMIRSRNERERS